VGNIGRSFISLAGVRVFFSIIEKCIRTQVRSNLEINTNILVYYTVFLEGDLVLKVEQHPLPMKPTPTESS
jgi:hypothetical protein